MGPEQPKVFISYNRADRDWAEWIAALIDRSGYQPIIQAWDFRPGQNFVLRMREAMADSDLTIAVLSEHYLNAAFTQSEWAAAFARDPTGKDRKLIPVRVAKCDLPPILSEIIYIDLVGQTAKDAERALLDGLKPSGKPEQPPSFPGKRTQLSISKAPFPPSLAKLYGVPSLPPHYWRREVDLAWLKKKLLREDAGVSTITPGQAYGLQGMGGIGKTVMAAALAHDQEVRQKFPGGIYWLTLGQNPNLLELQNRLLRQLTGSKQTVTTEEEARDALREALEGRKALVVVDDAWVIDHADAFNVTAAPARLLFTTRNNEVLVALGIDAYRVDVLTASDALKLLAEWVGETSPDKLPSEAAQVARECGFLPLALAMIGALIRLQPAGWKDALDCLRASDLEDLKRAFPGYPYPNLLRAIEVSIDALEAPEREWYLDLAVFPEAHAIPETALSLLWELDLRHTRSRMARLAARSLAMWAAGETSLILHDLQRDLIHKRRENELPTLHLRLTASWDALPKLDLYAWRWVSYHLIRAGLKDNLRRLLLDFDYLQAKLMATDANELIGDYDYLAEDEELHLLQSAIRLSSPVLARDPLQLAGQLTGRLLGIVDFEVLLQQAAKSKVRPWLCPSGHSLTAPGGPLIRTFEGHTGSVRAVAVTPDGSRAVSGSDDHTLKLWDLCSGQMIRTFEGHSDTVNSVAVTPDGCWAVSASTDKTLRLWDLETGETIRTLKGHARAVKVVVVTSNGSRALSSSSDSIRLWDLETGQTIRTLEGHTNTINAVAATPDGRRAVSVSEDHTLRLWDLESGQMIRSMMVKYDEIRMHVVAMTSDGRRAVAGCEPDNARLWDLESGQQSHVLMGHASWISAVAVTPDSRRAVSASWDHTLRVSDMDTGRTICTLEGHTKEVNAVAVTPDGRRAVSAADDYTLRLWDLENGQPIHPLGHRMRGVSAVAVTPDGRRAVSASADLERAKGVAYTLRLWDMCSGQTIITFQGQWQGNPYSNAYRVRQYYSVSSVAVTPDGRRAISASENYTLQAWDLEIGQMILTLEGHRGPVNDVAVTQDGCRAVSASDDRTLRVWDLEIGQMIRTLQGHTERVNAVSVTPDTRRAVSASDDQTLKVWGLKSGRHLRTLQGHGSPVSAVAITSDSRRVVSASKDHTLRLWDLNSGRTICTLEGHKDGVNAISVTPDGRAVSASDDRTLRLWNLGTGKTIRTLEGHTACVNAVAVTPDGRRAVSASDDYTLRLWDLEIEEEIATFTGESDMESCAITPDGQTIIAGDGLGRVHLLKLVEADGIKPRGGETKIRLLRDIPKV
jgi:WD40 repeat protein